MTVLSNVGYFEELSFLMHLLKNQILNAQKM